MAEAEGVLLMALVSVADAAMALQKTTHRGSERNGMGPLRHFHVLVLRPETTAEAVGVRAARAA